MKKWFVTGLTAIFTMILLIGGIHITSKAISVESPWSNGELGIHTFYTDTFVPNQPVAA